MAEDKKDQGGAANAPADIKALLQGSKDGNAGATPAGGGHRFWDTQPVLKLDEEINEVRGALEPDTKEIRQEPYNLPPGFEWSLCDMTSEDTMSEVYKLLNENYVEDDDNMFRFDYARDFLRWALTPPDFKIDWHIGVRNAKNKKLLAFITGVPAEIVVYGKPVKMVEINFLCIHKKLRSKRLAPVLIKEVTRRVNLLGIFQAVYTAGVLLPKPVSIARYWHRSLNPLKLIDVRFSYKPKNLTNTAIVKLYRVPEEPEVEGLRPLEAADVPSATKLLNDYLEKNFDLHPKYTEADFAHWFTPLDGVVYTYVKEKNGKISDLLSFYSLPSTIIGHPRHNKLNAAYSYYTVATTETYMCLMKQALILAKKHDFDVFNCLDILENDHTLQELKFGKGDGELHYYLYNYAAPQMPPKKLGLVLL